jgi:ATP-dependent protease ClpP protease subunit
VVDSDFTPNPDRAIWVEGQLTKALLEHLRPCILALTAHNRDPITVFINSTGGLCAVGEGILSLLRRTTEDDARVSKIITVAAPKAQSAAAELLSAGDFAIARPESALLYHGTHFYLPSVISPKHGKEVGWMLPTFHERAAKALARASVRRFLFIVSASRALFPQHRADAGDPAITDLQCFQAMLRGKLSPDAQKILETAVTLLDQYNGLMLQFRKRIRRGRAVTQAWVLQRMLHTSVEFEYHSNKGNPPWDGRLGRISEHFYFLNAYFRNENDEEFRELRDWIAAREQPQTPDDTDGEEADDLWFRLFFLALCRALQEGENYVTPTDALWLGLIDTVG